MTNKPPKNAATVLPAWLHGKEWELGFPLLLFVLAGLLALTGGNQPLFLLLNGWQDVIPGTLWAHITMFGDTAIITALILPFAVARPKLLFAFLFALFVGGMVNNLLKSGFAMPRPPAVLDADLISVYGPSHRGRSFPSGHSYSAWIAAGIFWGFYRRQAVMMLVAIVATLVCLSRVILGVHWPVDVLAGAGLGWYMGYLSVWVARKYAPVDNRWAYRAGIGLLILLTLYLFWYFNGHPETHWLQWLIAVAALGWTVRERQTLLLYAGFPKNPQ